MEHGFTRRSFVVASAAAATFAIALGVLGLAGCGSTSGREPNPASDFKTEEVDGGVAIAGYSGQSVEVVVPANIGGALVVAVGDGAFENKSAITYVELPGGVKGIGSRAFAGCSSLAKVSLPEGLTSIGNGAFSGTGLTEVVVPESLAGSVSAGVFPDGCTLKTAKGDAVEPVLVRATGETDDVSGLPIVEFGAYQQSGGDPEPIEWLVLEERADGTALLLSRRGLSARSYNAERTDVTWAECDLRAWLNGEFLGEAFNDAERGQIVEQTLTNPDNQEYGTPGGADTEDSVFCLSLQEVEAAFGAKPGDMDAKLVAYPTGRALEEGAYTYDNGACICWLRSPGNDASLAASVDPDGRVNAFGGSVGYDGICVRPALVVYL